RCIIVHLLLLLSTCYPPLDLQSRRYAQEKQNRWISRFIMAEKFNEKETTLIPILDGTNYSEWYLRMRFLLRSKDLLEVCKKAIGQDATPSAVNRWTKLSFEAITTITSRINRRVFLEVINSETSDKANLLWSKINKQYASKRAMNKGRVWMNWQKANYSGNLHHYVEETRKFLLKLDSVSVKMPSEILSYIILGKLAGDPKLNQVVELLTLNKEIIEKPDQILSRLQEYANHCQTKDTRLNTSPPVTDLVASSNEPFLIVYYCSNGKHNPKCLTNKKEECFAENPHLRPQKRDNKRKAPSSNPTTHFSTAQALYTNAYQRLSPGQLVVDCGATHHMFHSEEVFASLSKDTVISVTTGDSSSNLIAEGTGTVNLCSNDQVLSLPNSLFVPKLNCNLVILLKIFDKELIIKQNEESFTLITKGKEILQGNIENNLMKVDYHLPTSLKTCAEENPWHERLGHASDLVIKSMGLPLSDKSCEVCNLNKIHCLPFKNHFEPANLPLDCVHIDLVGPISPPSISGYPYFLTIVDQATSYKIIRFLKNKSDAFGQFLTTKKMMETQHDRLLKRLTSDQGGEFMNSHFNQLSDECGFIHSFSPAYTPEHNGFAERANRTILEKTRCMLNASNLPKNYWAEAVSTATLLSNYTPTPSRHNHSPYALWTKLAPRIKKLRIFGCQSFLMTPKEHREWKLSPSGAEEQRDKDTIPFSVSWDAVEGQAVVDEFHMPLECPLEPDNQESVDEVRISDDHDAAPTSELDLVDEILPVDETASPPLTKASRIKIIGPRHPTLICSDIDQQNILSHSRRAGALLTAAAETPRTFKAAISGDAKEVWSTAINKELQSMKRLRVWDVVDLDPSYKLVGTTWVFKRKKNHLGESAFLNAPLSETVYLSLPQGMKGDKRRICLRLNKAIYGLKQAPLAWYERLKQWLVDVGFKACILDPCVFYRSKDHPIWLYVHVDDIAIFGKEVEVFKAQIAGEFEIKDIGATDLMLRVKISQGKERITLDQQHYAESLIELYGMGSCRPVSTPLVPNSHLEPATLEEISEFNSLRVSYRSAIGSINYLSTATRPDLSFAVSSLLQFLDRPGIKHWQGFLHVLRYLSGSQDLGLTYGRRAQYGISAYSDADWGNCQTTQRSVTGYLACFNQCLVIWKTRKQPTVSLSTAEAEYRSLCDLTSELLWLRQWCQECGLAHSDGPIPVHEDNQGCINTANGDSNVNSRRMKHVDIQLHFVKEAIKCGRIQLRYTPSKEMLADFLTKSVPKPVLIHALDSLGVFRLGPSNRHNNHRSS
ncbi:hypothetical protein O181_078046, partial [Austropuccinia psidii MF-1]|nr:hypothetical protein [Austropuccinia psidii MF-1]